MSICDHKSCCQIIGEITAKTHTPHICTHARTHAHTHTRTAFSKSVPGGTMWILEKFMISWALRMHFFASFHYRRVSHNLIWPSTAILSDYWFCTRVNTSTTRQFIDCAARSENHSQQNDVGWPIKIVQSSSIAGIQCPQSAVTHAANSRGSALDDACFHSGIGASRDARSPIITRCC